jgi:tetratricopeptide (TPR) repeat protein
MFCKFTASSIGSFVLISASVVSGQTPAAPTAKAVAAGLIKLTGEDEKRARELDEQIDKAMKADRWSEAITKGEELLAMRTRVQGPKHFETVNAQWRVQALRRVAPRSREDRLAFQSISTIQGQADSYMAQGKYTAAAPLLGRVLEIHRRLLTDDHPLTASSYNNVALNYKSQGKYDLAQPLYEKALEIVRRLLTDEHPDTATAYNNLAGNLNAQGKYAQAQPLYEKALSI